MGRGYLGPDDAHPRLHASFHPSSSRCHYSTLAFSLLAHVLAAHTVQGDYQRWILEKVLEPLGMADTGFDLTPPVRARLAVGFYGSGRPAPLYDLGWYRPSGQMYSTTADLAKLSMVLLGGGPQRLLRPDTSKTLLAPLLACPGAYFANETGTPWEFHAQRGYRVVRKDGELDGYAATFSLVPSLTPRAKSKERNKPFFPHSLNKYISSSSPGLGSVPLPKQPAGECHSPHC